MMTLIFFLFWRLMRATFSSLTPPNRSPTCWFFCALSAAVLSSVSTKHRFGYSSYPLIAGVGRLDVQIGDVIGQDRHLVGVQLLQILVAQLLRLAAEVLDQFGDEGAGAGGGIEDFHLLVDQRLAEMLLAQPVGALDHEAHDLVRRVDHAEAVGFFLS